MEFMTRMEGVVMDMTGCSRETANLVVNAICCEIERLEQEELDDYEIEYGKKEDK